MSIRLRIQLLFTLIVALLTGLFSLIIFLRLESQRENNFYDNLHIRALIAADLILEEDEISKEKMVNVRKKFRVSLPHERIFIINKKNQFIFSSDSLYRIGNTFAIEQARTGKLVTFKLKDTQYVYMNYDDNGAPFVISAAAYDVNGHKYLNDIKVIILSGFILAIVISYSIGWWFSIKILKPINIIQKLASDISIHNLDRRIENVGNGKDELSALSRTFNTMFDRLEAAFKSQKQFVAQASHELRTPIAILKGEVGVALMKGRDVEEYKQILQSVTDNLSRMNNLANNLLMLARAESDKSNLHTDKIFLDEILFEAVEEIQNKFPNIQFEVLINVANLEEDNIYIIGNHDLIKSCFINLMDNAAKYSNKDVYVEMRIKENQISIDFIDNGFGIDSEEIKRVFEPFYRSENIRDVEGSGIGLALVKAIIEKHNGQVSIKSELDKGTTVNISLPIYASL